MNSLIYVSYALIIGLKNLGFSSNNFLYTLVFGCCCISIFSKIIGGKYTKKELLYIFLLLIVGLIDYFIGKNSTFLFSALLICSLKGLDLKKIIKILFFVKLITFIFMIVYNGVFNFNESFTSFYRDGVFLKRFAFGYSHANEAHLAFSTILFLYCYLYYDKIDLFKVIGLLIINYIFYKFTLSRTGFLTASFCLILFYLYKKNKSDNLKKVINYFLKNSYIIFFIITLLLSFLYTKIPYLDNFNAILSNRLQYNHILLTQYFPPLIGNAYYSSIVNIDNGFIALLYNCGIIAFIFFSYFYINLQRYYKQHKCYKELLLISCFILYAFSESFLPSVSINLSLIFFADVLFVRRDL